MSDLHEELQSCTQPQCVTAISCQGPCSVADGALHEADGDIRVFVRASGRWLRVKELENVFIRNDKQKGG